EQKLAAVSGAAAGDGGGENESRSMISEAIQALTALGFSGTEASRAVNSVALTPDMTSDDLLKAALKKL
ncbi:MAG: RuvA C-terminal domain-containing protein, partial [Lachnospiraceae bacterium]|nr:RuvA C-terminal domain-containing protein [Lachnospiraceae bacterium]